MPSLKDLASVTSKVDALAGELHSELTQGAVDFGKMVELADGIGAQADRLAAAFKTMADALEESLDGVATDGSESERQPAGRRRDQEGD